jgi:hypothetical protein
VQCTTSDRYDNEDKPYLTHPTNLSGFEGVLTIVPPHPSFSKAVPHWVNDWQASVHTCTKASQYCDHLSHTNINFPRLMDATFFRSKCALMAWITCKEPGCMTQMPCTSRCFNVEAISISICSDLLLFLNEPFAAGCKIFHQPCNGRQRTCCQGLECRRGHCKSAGLPKPSYYSCVFWIVMPMCVVEKVADQDHLLTT